MKQTKLKLSNGEIATIIDTDKVKVLKSENYNFFFNKKNGFFARWGKTEDDDGDPYLFLPEIADIEIDTSCRQGCVFCYKDNKPKGENMSLDTFKKILDKINKNPSIGQIAFGITDIDSNPEMFDIFDYCRSQDIVPNVTINGSRMTSEYFDRLAKTMGAVAVSAYDLDTCYNSIKELTDRGMTQVNIHVVVHSENFDFVKQILNDKLTDPRLSKLNAIVMLSIKPKGRAKDKFKSLCQEKYTELVTFALEHNIGIGADSCGCIKFYNAIKDNDKYKHLDKCLDSCESTLNSLYIDVNGIFLPCSFTPGTEGWENGISVLDCDDFLTDIWQNEKTKKFRDNVIKCKSCSKSCSIYDI